MKANTPSRQAGMALCLVGLSDRQPKGPGLAFILALVVQLAFAENFPGVIRISNNVGQQGLGRAVYILEDPEGVISINDLLRNPHAYSFQESKAEVPNFGFTRSVYWLRFVISNPYDASKTRYLEFGYPLTDEIELYQVHSGEIQSVTKMGDFYRGGNRVIKNRLYIFPITLDAEDSQVYYMRVKTQSSMQIPLVLWTNEDLLEKSYNEQLGWGAYVGIMVIMAFYNLFIFFILKDKNHLYYFIFIIVGSVISQLSFNGLAFLYLWPNSTLMANEGHSALIYLAIFVSTLFCINFLETRTNAPRLHLLLLCLLVLSLSGTLLSFFIEVIDSVKYSAVCGFLMIALFLWTSFYVWANGVKQARLFFIARIFLLVGIVLNISKAFGYLPKVFITDYPMQVGMVIEALLLSTALADRFNILRKQIIEAQEKTLAVQRKHLLRQKKLTDSYTRFVPHEFLNFLNRDEITEVQLGDNIEKQMSILFSDIRSFTSLSERMSPQDNFQFINSYLSYVGPVIRKNNGFIDKYIGDGIMALFSERAEDAVNAGLEMLRKLKEYNATRAADMPVIEIGIGINTGKLMLGIIGESGRMEGTVISDSVNLASRVQGLTRAYGNSILITESTYEELQHPFDYLIRRIGKVFVRGKSESITIYEVFNEDPAEIRQMKLAYKEQFENAVLHFDSGDYELATDLLVGYLAYFPQDVTAQLYLEKTQALRHKS